MLKNILKMFLAVGFVAVLSGCGGVIVVAAVIDASATVKEASENLKPFVQIVEVKVHKSTTTPTLQYVAVLPVILEANMEDVKDAAITSREKEVNNVITEEILLPLSISHNAISARSAHTMRVGTYYAEGGGYTVRKQYADISRVNKENREKWIQGRGLGIQKAIDFRLVLRNGDTTLMEARGFWGGNNQADEIAGARQLAREVASEVLKKLTASSSPPPTVAEKQ